MYSARSALAGVLPLVFAVTASACSASGPQKMQADAPKHWDDGKSPGNGPPLPKGYGDFPSDPIFDAPVGGMAPPTNAPTLFTSPGVPLGGPCLIEPEMGALVPRNWLPLRFDLSPVGDQNLFEIRIHADNQLNDLVVYTRQTSWTIPREIWVNLTAHSNNRPLQIKVRGAVYRDGALAAPPALGASGAVTIAPVAATGSIVYWMNRGSTGAQVTALRGFQIGEESVHDVIRPMQVDAGCVGCHTSTPDGQFAGFSAALSPNGGEPARLDVRAIDGSVAAPAFITPAARQLLARDTQQAPAFSKAHWSAGDHIMLSMLGQNVTWDIIWTDLEAPSADQGVGWGVITRTGDLGQAASAQLSHDGKTILYVSSSVVTGGVSTHHAPSDLYTVPYNDRKGGAASPVPGANSPILNEYYPSYAPGDQFIAFTRSGGDSYSNPASEIAVVPAGGGQAMRLRANDPPACTKKQSPGVTNSWPRWSPDAVSTGDATYYWLTFSSTRRQDGVPQIYVAAIVETETGISDYPALYLWNQPAEEKNHTPAWDTFVIP